jgi:hypothetical protein
LDFYLVAELRMVEIALIDGLCDLGGGGITLDERLHYLDRRAVFLLNYTLVFV